MSIGTHQNNAQHPNRLISEKSPYLLQHAYNPVDWYPWGPEAFEKARHEDKPIFLSIGYSTCHWCHVMEKESFEDHEVAELLNETFVCIKVDREERPDIDSVYMAICQSMTGGGGWPLSLILTHDKKAFYATTYIPKESKFGRMGMLDMIPRIKELWTSRRDEAEDIAAKIVSALKEVPAQGEELNEDLLYDAYDTLFQIFDEHHGGFGTSPKFPTPHNLLFLLRYWRRTKDEMGLYMVKKTLDNMYMGGVYDHIGFGFHRYSTDSKWHVPHFEKMLYDQAMIAMAYIEAYQATGDQEYEKIARQIFTYVIRDMTDPEGGFYSAEDADSEGEEGKFYLWTHEEIYQVLSREEADMVITIFNIERDGNFLEEATGKMTGRNIVYFKKMLSKTASAFNISPEDMQNRWDLIRQKLYIAREKRVHPHKDDKILTDWNGLMIAALAKGAQVLDEPHYVQAASRSADFILRKMLDSKGRLYHRYREGEFAIPAFLDDYAFFIFGLIELYETTFKIHYLQKALDLTDVLLKHFWDENNGGFFFTADDAEDILLRKKEIYDGALPSGNSIAMLNLLRLGRITGNPEFENRAVQIGQAFFGVVSQAPAACTYVMTSLDFAVGPTAEIVIVGEVNKDDTKAMLEALQREFIPNKVVIFRPGNVESPEITHFARYTSNLSSKDGAATAYVCHNYDCKLPTENPKKMLELLYENIK
jgi:uncharacterized protein YyaL (SSP411 family)